MESPRSIHPYLLCAAAGGLALGPEIVGFVHFGADPNGPGNSEQGAMPNAGLAWLWWLGLFGPLAGGLVGQAKSWRGVALVVLFWVAVGWWFTRAPGLDRMGFVGVTGGLLMLGFGAVRSGLLGLAPSAPVWVWIGTLVLCALPSAGGWLGPAPWPPGWAARMLDVSPVALALEASGVDFLRLEAVYGPVGADAIGPGLRIAWGALAGWGALVVGCVLGVVGSRRSQAPKA